MKRILLSLALVTLVAAAPAASAARRVSFGFSYGNPYRCYRPAYAYPVYTAYPRYRHKRSHRLYYSRAYSKHRPYTCIVFTSCY